MFVRQEKSVAREERERIDLDGARGRGPGPDLQGESDGKKKVDHNGSVEKWIAAKEDTQKMDNYWIVFFLSFGFLSFLISFLSENFITIFAICGFFVFFFVNFCFCF